MDPPTQDAVRMPTLFSTVPQSKSLIVPDFTAQEGIVPITQPGAKVSVV
jgi:hypothetical protein